MGEKTKQAKKFFRKRKELNHRFTEHMPSSFKESVSTITLNHN
jgi:hypothetical protein